MFSMFWMSYVQKHVFCPACQESSGPRSFHFFEIILLLLQEIDLLVIVEDIQDIVSSSTSIILPGILVSIEFSQKIRQKTIKGSQHCSICIFVLKKGGMISISSLLELFNTTEIAGATNKQFSVLRNSKLSKLFAVCLDHCFLNCEIRGLELNRLMYWLLVVFGNCKLF